MRICSPQLGISPTSNLGGEVHDREMLRALADNEVQIEIILPLGKKHDDHKNWKISYLPTPFVYPPFIFNLLVIPYLFILYFKCHFDVIRVHSPEFVGFAAVFFKLFFPKVKIVATFHHLDEGKLPFLANKFLAGKFDLVTVATQKSQEEYISEFDKENKQKIVVIPHGISNSYYPDNKNQELIKKYSLENKHVLLYLGQLIARKNLPFALEVLKILPQDYVLIIAGDGPEKDNLIKKAECLNLGSRIFFAGKVSESEKNDYYNLADIFVFPSLLEGFGMTIVEAQKCGRVVIVSPSPIFSDFVQDGKTGLVEDLSPEKWAKRISSVLENKQQYKNISGNAVLSAKKFTWHSAAEKYLTAVKNL